LQEILIRYPEPSSEEKTNVALAKRAEHVRAIKRQGDIAAWNDYIGFGVSKALGAAALVVGGLVEKREAYITLISKVEGRRCAHVALIS
jgi:hypothetical protein